MTYSTNSVGKRKKKQIAHWHYLYSVTLKKLNISVVGSEANMVLKKFEGPHKFKQIGFLI